MEKYKSQFKSCLQKEDAFCTAVCPFHLDVRQFTEKMGRGNYNSAFRTYRDAVGFPRIVAALCHAPCESVCPRNKTDRSIGLNLLEKACLSYATRLDPNDYNLPVKNKKIAVIGGGISGLACTLRLSSKKYALSVYEKTDRIGGHLWDVLSEEVFMHDIEEQFKFENYTLHLNKEVDHLKELLDYDVIYVATGKDGRDYGLLNNKLPKLVNDKTAVFLGGSILGKGIIEAIADGLNNAAAIERYLRTGVVMPHEDKRSTKMALDSSKLSYSKPILPENHQFYSKEEAEAEANRCLRCQCDACRNYSDLIRHYNKWPLRVKDEVMATILPGEADLKATIAKRLIHSNMMDGIFKATCPMGIDLDGMMIQARRSLHRQGKQPWAFHDFWLKDMDWANGEKASIVKSPRGFSKSNYAFFPGCQLGASHPEYVLKTYEYLLKYDPGTALMLECCGVPAQWAGNEKKHKEVIEKIRRDWIRLGSPKVVVACPTCKKKFDEFLPDLPVLFIYDIIIEFGITAIKNGEGMTYSIFDPCSSRDEPQLHTHIRQLLAQSGYKNEPVYEDYPRCCSFGGQVSIAHPEFAEAVVKRRIDKSDNPYMTYCINCRDIFASTGKSVLHILDVLFGVQNQKSKPATVTKRRENRYYLKNTLLKQHWGEEMKLKEGLIEDEIKLTMSPAIIKKLDSERIIEEDIKEVVLHCNKTKKRIHHLKTGHYTGYKKIGNMTYWVEYRPVDDGFELINVYSHRMKIDLEVVWNGKRRDVDV